jgi:hypothetical protein
VVGMATIAVSARAIESAVPTSMARCALKMYESTNTPGVASQFEFVFALESGP